MRDVLGQSDSYWLRHLWSGLFGTFAAVALTIAAVGLLGVISHIARRRSHEMGVWLALGVTPGEMRRLVPGGGARLPDAGIIIGMLGAMATSRPLAGMLYGVTSGGPRTFVAVSVVILAVALLASYLPARRAANVARHSDASTDRRHLKSHSMGSLTRHAAGRSIRQALQEAAWPHARSWRWHMPRRRSSGPDRCWS